MKRSQRFLLALLLMLLLVPMVPVNRSLAATSHPAQMADSFVDSIGVNTHLYFTDTGYGNFAAFEPLLVASGIRHIRDGNASPHVSNRGAQYYPRLTDLARKGIHATLINDPRNDNQTAQQQVANLAIIGPGVVEAMEGPNEYDASGDANWASDLLSFQQQLHSAVKSSYPSIPVIGPSVGTQSSARAGNMNAFVDSGNMHPYRLWPPGPLSGTLSNEIGGHEATFGAKPMVATEFGYPTATRPPGASLSVTEAVQAKYVERAFLEGWLRGVRRMWDFQFLDGLLDPTNSEANFGLLRADYSKKPAYTALQNLTNLLGDPGPTFAAGALSYDIGGNTANVHQLLLQKRNGTFYLLLWLEVPSTGGDVSQPVTITLGQSVGRVSTFLPTRSAAATNSYDNVSHLNVAASDSPLVVRVELAAPKAAANTTTTAPAPPPSARPTAPPLTASAQAAPTPTLGMAKAAIAKPAASRLDSTPWVGRGLVLAILVLGLAGATIPIVTRMRRRLRKSKPKA